MPRFDAAQRRPLFGCLHGRAAGIILVTLSLLAQQGLTIASTRYLPDKRSPRPQASQGAAEPASRQLTAQQATPPASPAQPAKEVAPTAPRDDNKDKKDKEEKAGTPATVVDGQQLESVLGVEALSPTGEDMGRIVDIIVDHTGQVRAAIIDFGGFLGVGSRKIAVDWRMLHFPANGKGDTVIVNLTKDQLRVAPVYKPGEPVVVLGGPGGKP